MLLVDFLKVIHLTVHMAIIINTVMPMICCVTRGAIVAIFNLFSIMIMVTTFTALLLLLLLL